VEKGQHAGIAKVGDPGTWNVSTWKLIQHVWLIGCSNWWFSPGAGIECGVLLKIPSCPEMRLIMTEMTVYMVLCFT
jgi:hypothetical protein